MLCKPRLTHTVFFLAMFTFIVLSALAGQNDNATFTLDFVTDESDTKTTSTIEAAPVIDGDGFFTASLVLQGATALTGLTVDLNFDNQVVRVVSINETVGDVNFDGRSNIADVLALAERFNFSTTANPELDYFDLEASGLIDMDDINLLLGSVNSTDLYWTSNPNTDGFSDFETYPESVEVFEDPEVSNAKGMIDDIAVVLLPRQHPPAEAFGFAGDARVATIVFQIIGGDSGAETTLSFSDAIVLDQQTVINDDGSFGEGTESRPESPEITITIP